MVRNGFSSGKTKKQPEFLSTEEQERIMDQPNPRWPTGQRNRLIMEFLLLTGARVSEMCAMKWTRINLNTGLIQIKDGKGGKDRSVYADEGLLQDLRSWRQRQEGYGPADFVFTTLKGDAVSPRYVQQMIKRYREKSGFDKKVTPHTMRHTYASDLFRETKDILLVQQMLGHEDVSTTMIYTHLQNEDVREELSRAAAARRAKWAIAKAHRKNEN